MSRDRTRDNETMKDQHTHVKTIESVPKTRLPLCSIHSRQDIQGNFAVYAGYTLLSGETVQKSYDSGSPVSLSPPFPLRITRESLEHRQGFFPQLHMNRLTPQGLQHSQHTRVTFSPPPQIFPRACLFIITPLLLASPTSLPIPSSHHPKCRSTTTPGQQSSPNARST